MGRLLLGRRGWWPRSAVPILVAAPPAPRRRVAWRRDRRSRRASSRDARRPRRPGAGRADGGGLGADLPDQHLRPGRRRPAARRLGVRADPEPDALAARAGGRRARGRPLRPGLRQRIGDHRGHRRAGRAGRRDPRQRRRLRRHLSLLRAGGPRARRAGPLPRPGHRPGRGAARRADRSDAHGLARDPLQPAPQARRPGGGRGRPG